MPRHLHREVSLAQYRLRARFYDDELAAFEPVRRSAIAALQLCPGDTVLDVGCGTGLSFELLQQGICTHGHLVGIEQSPDMIVLARQRVAQHHWRNVTLCQASAESAEITVQADAALFHFTHDIVTNPLAVKHLASRLKPNARVVVAGLQWSAPWNWPTNWLVLLAAMYSATTLAGLGQPWALLQAQLGDMESLASPLPGTFIVRRVMPRAAAT